ncbi:hypothetical protein JYQ62_19640 [Nostoc sp. UHCC 0702]|nr:hypothetical protein JYQ62_19640 [Nostoc sp. UHCC 0702]
MQLQLHLHEYPGAIANLQVQLLKLDQSVEQISQRVKHVCDQFELQTAFDPELKNEQQRKAKKAELIRQSGDYEQLNHVLGEETYRRDILCIQLEQLKSEFSVAKLLKRETVARVEAFADEAA